MIALDPVGEVSASLALTAASLQQTAADLAQAQADLLTKLPNTPTLSSPARSLDVSFQPSLTALADVRYALTCVGKVVTLKIGPTDPPTQVVSPLAASLVGGIGTLTTQGQLSTWVPAGWYVELVSSGIGSASLDNVQEAVFA